MKKFYIYKGTKKGNQLNDKPTVGPQHNLWHHHKVYNSISTSFISYDILQYVSNTRKWKLSNIIYQGYIPFICT
jgi:hypothetical protein